MIIRKITKVSGIVTILLLLVTILIPLNCGSISDVEVFIRTSQVGFNRKDIKTGVIMSKIELGGSAFSVVKANNNEVVYKGNLPDSVFKFGVFDYCYQIEFSEVKERGKYKIKYGVNESYIFSVGENVFNGIADSLALFFEVQRCGPTSPRLHGVCHLYDVARVVGDDQNTGSVDATGGWHDAADYVKFLSTSAYTTYLLIFSYQFDKEKYGFDNNGNGAPDLLEEARVGLDWLLRANYGKGKLITQVQDLRDHEVGWRLPENDTLRYDRPGYSGLGKNQIGLFAAALALGAKVWKERFYDDAFAKKCLDAAESLYALKDNAADIDKVQSGMYQDSQFWGKLALGAIELYNTTRKSEYLREAMVFADSAKSDYWWSWGNMNSLAHYRIGKINKRFAYYIQVNLDHFNNHRKGTLFGEGSVFSWGSTNTLLGISLQAILYKDLTGSSRYDSLAIFQRDYVLGKNPWGVTFIHNIGKDYPRELHSQVAYFNGGYLPGGVTAGPAPESILSNYNISRSRDRFAIFNTDSVKYYDDRGDYVTNEPAIVSNATALFVYGYYSSRRGGL
jgi:endoglucanase